MKIPSSSRVPLSFKPYEKDHGGHVGCTGGLLFANLGFFGNLSFFWQILAFFANFGFCKICWQIAFFFLENFGIFGIFFLEKFGFLGIFRNFLDVLEKNWVFGKFRIFVTSTDIFREV
jgi:hypothetical protein